MASDAFWKWWLSGPNIYSLRLLQSVLNREVTPNRSDNRLHVGASGERGGQMN